MGFCTSAMACFRPQTQGTRTARLLPTFGAVAAAARATNLTDLVTHTCFGVRECPSEYGARRIHNRDCVTVAPPTPVPLTPLPSGLPTRIFWSRGLPCSGATFRKLVAHRTERGTHSALASSSTGLPQRRMAAVSPDEMKLAQ